LPGDSLTDACQDERGVKAKVQLGGSAGPVMEDEFSGPVETDILSGEKLKATAWKFTEFKA